MPVRVVKPDHPLSPGVFLYWVDVLDGKGFQPPGKRVEPVLLKINLPAVSAENNLIRFQKARPAFQRLQTQAAFKRLIGPKIQDDPKPQDGLVKRQGPRHIRYRQQGIFQFHTGKPP